jgi:hypothetical protein
MQIIRLIGVALLLLVVLALIIWAVWDVSPSSDRSSILSLSPQEQREACPYSGGVSNCPYPRESEVDQLPPVPPAPKSICRDC